MRNLDEETKEWLAIRKEAAKVINPATAVVTWWYARDNDPYGIQIPDEADLVGRNYFARAPGSDVWVSFQDLPKSVKEELYKPRPSRSCDKLPDVNGLVADIMARDSYDSGYAAGIASGIAAKLAANASPGQSS